MNTSPPTVSVPTSVPSSNTTNHCTKLVASPESSVIESLCETTVSEAIDSAPVDCAEEKSVTVPNMPKPKIVEESDDEIVFLEAVKPSEDGFTPWIPKLQKSGSDSDNECFKTENLAPESSSSIEEPQPMQDNSSIPAQLSSSPQRKQSTQNDSIDQYSVGQSKPPYRGEQSFNNSNLSQQSEEIVGATKRPISQEYKNLDARVFISCDAQQKSSHTAHSELINPSSGSNRHSPQVQQYSPLAGCDATPMAPYNTSRSNQPMQSPTRFQFPSSGASSTRPPPCRYQSSEFSPRSCSYMETTDQRSQLVLSSPPTNSSSSSNSSSVSRPYFGDNSSAAMYPHRPNILSSRSSVIQRPQLSHQHSYVGAPRWGTPGEYGHSNIIRSPTPTPGLMMKSPPVGRPGDGSAYYTQKMHSTRPPFANIQAAYQPQQHGMPAHYIIPSQQPQFPPTKIYGDGPGSGAAQRPKELASCMYRTPGGTRRESIGSNSGNNTGYGNTGPFVGSAVQLVSRSGPSPSSQYYEDKNSNINLIYTNSSEMRYPYNEERRYRGGESYNMGGNYSGGNSGPSIPNGSYGHMYNLGSSNVGSGNNSNSNNNSPNLSHQHGPFSTRSSGTSSNSSGGSNTSSGSHGFPPHPERPSVLQRPGHYDLEGYEPNGARSGHSSVETGMMRSLLRTVRV